MIASFPAPKRLALALLRTGFGRRDVEGTRGARAVITLSAVTRRQIREIYGVDSVPAYEGADVTFFRPIPAPENPVAREYTGRRLIFHATDFTPIKNTEALARAFPEISARCPDAFLAISNTIEDPREKRRLEALLAASGMAGRFRFLGCLPYEDLPRYYSAACAVVQPSINQPMSLPVKEALACGAVVVRTREEETEFGPDDRCGFLTEPQEPGRLATDVVRALELSPDERRARGREGRSLVESRFTWDAVAAVYARVLGSGWEKKLS
jgi:glycosyltransferase involved in cell wall biosynthesis